MVRNDRWGRVGGAGMGAVRVALLFGSAAVALALILTPIADRRAREVVKQGGVPQGLDRMSTGTVSRGGYTIRRSVLQNTPGATCIIRHNGRRSGNC